MLEALTLERLRGLDPDTAAALLVSRRGEGAAGMDAPVLEAWLRLDPANRDAWRAAEAAWSDFDAAEGDEILDALRAEARRAGPARSWRGPAAAAAAVALLVAGGVALRLSPPAFLPSPGAPSGAPVSTITYAAAPEAWEDVRLADGTRMRLDAASTAAVSIGPERREVTLVRGRAFFEVVPDPQRPFAVRAADQEVVALGTRFDVRVRAGETRVVLVEGRVAVRPLASRRAATLMRPGQQLVVRGGEAPRLSPVDPQQALTWGARYVVFEDATLADAARALSRYGAGRLVVRDPEVAALRVSGRFRADDLPRFGRSLGLLLPVRLAPRGPGEWEIVRAR